MYNFTLTDFFYNYKVINFFIDLQIFHPEYFILNDICFNYYQGSFSYNYFNGEYNTNQGPITLATDYSSIAKNLIKKPIRFSLSNINLEKNDIYDRQFNKFLNYFNNQGHSLEITDLNFLNYIKNQDYNYNFILSQNIFLTLPFNKENLLSILENNKDTFLLIQLPNNINLNDLKDIKLKKYLEIVINPNCYNCENLNNCILKEQQYQINYSNKSFFKICKNFTEKVSSISEIQNYYKMGFNHFIIKSNPQHSSYKYLLLLINIFIKEEYKFNVLIEWNNYND